ncbi:MAG TPA: M20/M25/M40 family metallo-hydrolase [Solirubrobacteraceae bacterium]|nr:M20/M25/M40 family metallo-hydrolase [Solirubrobacteraceae bacterium]
MTVLLTGFPGFLASALLPSIINHPTHYLTDHAEADLAGSGISVPPFYAYGGIHAPAPRDRICRNGMSTDASSLRDEAVELLRDLLRVDTSNPPGNETAAAVVLKRYLEAAGVECELVARDPDRANLVARIPGTGDGPSLALLGHTDVVPADAQDWTRPPFAGELDEDGYVWGRGAADMKNETVTRAVTIATLGREGFRPKGDLTFIAEADEENGEAQVGLSWLVQTRPDLRCDYALNEGGGERLVLADGRVVVPISVGEKACLPAHVIALGEAGHASTPEVGANAVPRLAALIRRLASFQPERRLIPASRVTLETLAGPVDGDLDAALARALVLEPELETMLPATLQTTIAATRLHGSPALNVMPGRATVECDCRLVPGSTPEDLELELRTALGGDLPYEIHFPSPLVGGSSSRTDTPLFEVCQAFLDRADPGAVLLPIIGTGFTDSHFLREAFGTVAYGFWPFRRTPVDTYRRGVHNRDERLHVDDLVYATEFHLEVCRAIGQRPR